MEGYRENNWRDTGDIIGVIQREDREKIIGRIKREKLEGYRENNWRDKERKIGGIQGE